MLYRPRTLIFEHSTPYLEVKLDIFTHLETCHHQTKHSFCRNYIAQAPQCGTTRFLSADTHAIIKK